MLCRELCDPTNFFFDSPNILRVMSDSMPHHSGHGEVLGDLGKRLAPALSRGLLRSPFLDILRYASMYLEVIQGKGSGAGWDLRGEAKVAGRFINSKSPIIFDVGAHTGSWTRAILETIGSECNIYQFEPALQNINILRNQNRDNIVLIEKAVSSTNGHMYLYFSKSASDTSSLYERRESIFRKHEYTRYEVEVTTLDNIIDKLDIDRVDFLKMDIEGHEFDALKGAKKSLIFQKIRTLTFEFGSGNINSRTFFRDFWDLLIPLGYSINRICPGGVLMPIEQYYEDLEYFRNVTNYVATLEEVRAP